MITDNNVKCIYYIYCWLQGPDKEKIVIKVKKLTESNAKKNKYINDLETHLNY